MATPITTCCARISKPAAEPGSTSGMGPSTGDTTSVMATISPILALRGKPGLPSTGALATSAAMRNSGQMNAVSQAKS